MPSPVSANAVTTPCEKKKSKKRMLEQDQDQDAIREIMAENKTLRAKNTELENKNTKLENKNTELEDEIKRLLFDQKERDRRHQRRPWHRH